jgi:hypothetical protein
MASYQAEAQDLLLRRRRSLQRQVVGTPPPGGPESRWLDVEAMPEPVAEPVRRELHEIDAALRRIGDGSYGACLACGGPMGLQRIRAIPEARYCVGCSGQGLLGAE